MASLHHGNESSVEYDSRCPICFDTFDEGHKLPKNLSCHHVVCLLCLQEMLHRTRKITCPLCRCAEADRVDPANLATDSAVLSVVKLIEERRDATIRWCYGCSRTASKICSRAGHVVVAFQKEALFQAGGGLLQLREAAHGDWSRAVEDRLEISRRLTAAVDWLAAWQQRLGACLERNGARGRALAAAAAETAPDAAIAAPAGGDVRDLLDLFRRHAERAALERQQAQSILDELRALDVDLTSTPVATTAAPMGSGWRLPHLRGEFGDVLDAGDVGWAARFVEQLVATPAVGAAQPSSPLWSTIQPARKRRRSTSPAGPVQAPPFARILYGETSLPLRTPQWLHMFPQSGPFSSSEMACCPPEERHRASVVDCAWNAAGDVLACAVDTGAVQFVTCGSGGGSFRSSFVRLPDAGAVRCVDWNEEGDRLAAGSDSGIVFVLRLGRPESAAEAPEAPEAALRHHSGAVRLVKWNRLGSADLLATTGIDGTTSIWNAASWTQLQVVAAAASAVLCCDWLSAHRFVRAQADGRIVVWPVGERRPAKSVSFTASQEHVHATMSLTSSGDGLVRVVSSLAGDASRVHRFRGRRAPGAGVDFCFSDVKTDLCNGVLARIHQWSVQLWRVADAVLLQTLTTRADVRALRFSPDAAKLAAATASSVTVWNTTDWTRVTSITFDGRYRVGLLVWNGRSDKLAACLGCDVSETSQPVVHVIQINGD